MFRSGHLKDAQLLDCYLAGRHGETLDPRHADHLSSCGDCRGQFEALATFMDDVRVEGEADADEIFTADFLQTQHAQIAHRLEHVHRTARVISFPGREVASGGRTPATLTTRWLAAAAAAGLFIGVAVGGYLGPERLRPYSRQSAARLSAPAAAPAATTPVPTAATTRVTPPPQLDDDAFLMELELALARPQPRELAAFDAMTPHVRDLR